MENRVQSDLDTKKILKRWPKRDREENNQHNAERINDEEMESTGCNAVISKNQKELNKKPQRLELKEI